MADSGGQWRTSEVRLLNDINTNYYECDLFHEEDQMSINIVLI